jgi:hypothetical protein
MVDLMADMLVVLWAESLDLTTASHLIGNLVRLLVA